MKEVQSKKDKREKKLLMAEAMVEKAIDGDVPAFREVADRMEGKPIQPTDITSLGEKLVTGVICLPVQDGGSLETKSGKTDRSSKEKRA